MWVRGNETHQSPQEEPEPVNHLQVEEESDKPRKVSQFLYRTASLGLLGYRPVVLSEGGNLFRLLEIMFPRTLSTTDDL